MANDINWLSGVQDIRKKWAEQQKYLNQGLAEIDRARAAAQRQLQSEVQKRDLRIKAAREKERRTLLAAEQARLANISRTYGPPGPVLVGGQDVVGLPRHPKNSGDVGGDTQAGDGSAK